MKNLGGGKYNLPPINKGDIKIMEDNEYEQLLINAVVISRVISDELKGNYSYENIVKIADELNIEPYQVQAFYKLYERVQTMMVI